MIDHLLTQRLCLRRWRDADREPFAELNADPEVMKFFPNRLDRQASDAMVDRIEEGFGQRGFGLWAVERLDDERFLGFVGLSVPAFDASFLPGVEVGWRLAVASWGHGFATEAAAATLADGFGRCGLTEILSFTATVNVPSIRVMQRLGMTHVTDFDHPSLPSGDPLERHVLYRIERDDETLANFAT